MTSNVGSHDIAEHAVRGGGELNEGVKREVLDALRAQFRPEFINRVDEIIVFHALTREQMRDIIDIQLRGLMKRLEDRKIHVELTDRAKDLLIAEGYDPTYGARPLKRTIQRPLDGLAQIFDFVAGVVEAQDANGVEEALHVFAQAEDGRAAWRGVTADAFKDAGAVVHRGVQQVNGGLLIGNQAAVHPDKLGRGGRGSAVGAIAAGLHGRGGVRPIAIFPDLLSLFHDCFSSKLRRET